MEESKVSAMFVILLFVPPVGPVLLQTFLSRIQAPPQLRFSPIGGTFKASLNPYILILIALEACQTFAWDPPHDTTLTWESSHGMWRGYVPTIGGWQSSAILNASKQTCLLQVMHLSEKDFHCMHKLWLARFMVREQSMGKQGYYSLFIYPFSVKFSQ